MTDYASVGALFDKGAGDYDALRRKMIPCFTPFYQAACAAVWGAATGPAPQILDLGAGSGLFSWLLLQNLPKDAAALLVDLAPNMLAEADRRFDGDARAKTQVGDLTDPALFAPGRYDAVISALAIHHLSAADRVQLFARAHAALRPGGVFVNAEQILGPTPTVEAQYRRAWRDAVAEAGATEAEISAALERMAADRCAPLEDQLAELRGAGFQDVDCPFKALRFAVYCGRRA